MLTKQTLTEETVGGHTVTGGIAAGDPVCGDAVSDSPAFDGKRKLRVLVCVSGGGTNLQAIIDAKKRGGWRMRRLSV